MTAPMQDVPCFASAGGAIAASPLEPGHCASLLVP